MTAPAGTQNRRTLKAIEDILEGKVAKDIQSYTINGRQLYKMDVDALMKLKTEYTRRCLDDNGQSIFGEIRFT